MISANFHRFVDSANIVELLLCARKALCYNLRIQL